MRFVNREEATQVRTGTEEDYQWILLKTGEEIDIPSKTVAKFKAGSALTKNVN